ncbi:Panacea domain-containing protein [Levilactobacillus spicheri]|uniref:Antitoxin SocA-like Panacea domain-containing protein n=1 Tax=Levilactobacillus spicheri TaxID=216463 RepID=A0ABQ0WNA9_9LACO|nr:type II toxin-antitoxin system antitoxin SocA domain-containing protein [Levilactobacillus spicheri]GEO66498.1 hypothetical protein LSP04_09170 [Levilactobacillus spicheri]
MSMSDLSQHILAVGKMHNLSVTNLALQKVMYFSVQDYLRQHGQDDFITALYDTPFETWQYGPVIPEIYFEFSAFGSMSISEAGHYHSALSVLDSNIVSLLKEDVFDLVNRSHEQSFWQQHRADGRHEDAQYKLSDIMSNC